MELANLQSKIKTEFTKFINSAEYREKLEANFKKFEEIFREISEGKITNLEFFLNGASFSRNRDLFFKKSVSIH